MMMNEDPIINTMAINQMAVDTTWSPFEFSMFPTLKMTTTIPNTNKPM